jgi:hypothetical protein
MDYEMASMLGSHTIGGLKIIDRLSRTLAPLLPLVTSLLGLGLILSTFIGAKTRRQIQPSLSSVRLVRARSSSHERSTNGRRDPLVHSLA